MKENVSWHQENIKGYILQLSIKLELSDKGMFEEYEARAHAPIGRFVVEFSIIICVISIFFTLHIVNVFIVSFLICVIILFVMRVLFYVNKEVVMYMPQVGLQQTTFYVCGIRSPHFIPSNNIEHIIINEDLGWYPMFYLAVVLKDGTLKNKLFPLFRNTKPRLEFLQHVLNRMLKLDDMHRGS